MHSYNVAFLQKNTITAINKSDLLQRQGVYFIWNEFESLLPSGLFKYYYSQDDCSSALHGL